MKRFFPFPRLLMIVGIGGLLALLAFNIFETWRAYERANQRWVARVSDMLVAERSSWIDWADTLPNSSDDRQLLSFASRSTSLLDAAFVIDSNRHTMRQWVSPSAAEGLEVPDPRLVALEIRVLHFQKTRIGPVIVSHGMMYCSVVRPLDDHRVFIAVLRDRRISSLLSEESLLWHMQCFVYDYDKNPIFATHSIDAVSSSMNQIVAAVRSGVANGHVSLHRPWQWEWVSTFHYDSHSDWIFIVMQPVVWVYLPCLFVALCVIGGVWLGRAPWRAAEELRRRQWSSELSRFASRVDNFVRGRDVVLQEPPYPFSELVPIVMALRWLMPQWKKAEAFPNELALERKLLALLIESLPEGILFFNAQGGMQLSNELGRVFLNLQQEAGKEYKMVSGMQVPRGFLEPFTEPVFLGEQKNLGKEVEVGWADGKHLYRVWVENVEELEGKAAGFIVVVRDITFRKQWEYVQEQVLSGITHDLRGPLSAVIGYLDLLRRQVGEAGPPKQVEYLKFAREAAARLNQMVNDILDVVRFEQGKVDLQVEAIPVTGIFKRLHTTFGITAEQKKVSLKFNLNADAAMVVSGDPKLLERVFDNLVGNAIKFTPSGGQITVSASRQPNRSVFEVQDTGRGIPREAQSRIFDKFQQVRPGDRSAGYGLGLAVAKFIVETHKGELRVESEVGVGSRFTFWVADMPITAVPATPDA